MQMNKNSEQPFVSIVTPVFNGAKYLSECIESVINQSYANWEYVIVNNCSTDATADIVNYYAPKDNRIRLHNNQIFLEIIPNWNEALRQISAESKYCKVIHADDLLFPECIEKMVKLAEANQSVGIVASYRINGPKGVFEGGLPYPCSVISGKEVCRNTFSRKYFIFGSPSTRLIRSDLIRKRKSYYNEAYFHADTAECFEQLQHNDFGFVHQVLSYTRRNDTAMTETYARPLATEFPERLSWLKEYGPVFFENNELNLLIKSETLNYYYLFVDHIIKRSGKDFFNYHKNRMKKYGLNLSKRKLLFYLIRRIVHHPYYNFLLFTHKA